MKRKRKIALLVGVMLLVAFVLWTVLVSCVDVRAIGPQGSSVGLATINELVHGITGSNMTLYVITDWLGLVPIGIALCFAIIGLAQWIKRRKMLLVDQDILLLGAFYAIVMAVYVLFEIVHVNFRPVLINGYLEASYPSSTTMLVMTVVPTAMLQINIRIKNSILKRVLTVILSAFIAFMVMGRLISGVHWISDIIGGALFSIGIVTVYYSVYDMEFNKKKKST